MDLDDSMEKEDVLKIGIGQERVISELVPFFSNAIRQLHSKSIVHQDLSKSNIVQCGGVWKFADFGLAEFEDNQFAML